MWKSNFDIQIFIATFKIKKRPFTFSKPALEASPVLTLGISSKGQVRTRGGAERPPLGLIGLTEVYWFLLKIKECIMPMYAM